MERVQHHVTVAADLRHLIPIFLANRGKELEALRDALAAGKWEVLRQLGSRMKGVGIPYGFQRVSALGEQIVAGAEIKESSLIESSISEYADYLSGLQVTFTE
jgi:hypothetical protein